MMNEKKAVPPFGLDKVNLSIELRDLFAMHAMVAMIEDTPINNIPRRAYSLADAMLEARKK